MSSVHRGGGLGEGNEHARHKWGRRSGMIAFPLIVAALIILSSSPAAAQPQAKTIPRGGESNVPPTANLTERSQMAIVGSPIMEPYVDAVIDALQSEYFLPVPSEDYKGTASGIKKFCGGIGPGYPDIIATEREMRKTEFDSCIDHGILDMIEIKIGRSAVVVVTKKGAPVFNVTPRMLYLGLAAETPQEGGGFVPNPYKSWRDVGKDAPDLPISVFIPKEGGERDYFNANFLEGGCRHVKAIDAIFAATDRVAKCTTLRADGHVTEVANVPRQGHELENPVLDILQQAPPGSLAVVLRPHYWLNKDELELLPVNGLLPQPEEIRDLTYDMTMDLRFYFKRRHMRDNEGRGVVRGLREFMHYITRDKASGEGGVFEKMGLISLPPDVRAEMRRNARTLRRFTR
jgi:phosphate transport system substrate-binding protein